MPCPRHPTSRCGGPAREGTRLETKIASGGPLNGQPLGGERGDAGHAGVTSTNLVERYLAGAATGKDLRAFVATAPCCLSEVGERSLDELFDGHDRVQDQPLVLPGLGLRAAAENVCPGDRVEAGDVDAAGFELRTMRGLV